MLNTSCEGVIKEYLLSGVISLSIEAFLSEYDVEDGVRAAACLVHVGGSHSPAHTVKTCHQFVQQCDSYKDRANYKSCCLLAIVRLINQRRTIERTDVWNNQLKHCIHYKQMYMSSPLPQPKCLCYLRCWM